MGPPDESARLRHVDDAFTELLARHVARVSASGLPKPTRGDCIVPICKSLGHSLASLAISLAPVIEQLLGGASVHLCHVRMLQRGLAPSGPDGSHGAPKEQAPGHCALTRTAREACVELAESSPM